MVEKPTEKRKKKHSKIRLVIVAVIAAVGISVLAYPWFMNLVYDDQVSQLKNDFLQTATNEQSSDFDALYRYLKQENENLAQTNQAALVDAFSYQTAAVDLGGYGIKDGIIGFISLPKINIELPIRLGANSENMQKGAVHLTQTSYPIGGASTNAVIAAHRGNLMNMFRHIDELQVGDEVKIINFRETLVYQVVNIEIIDPHQIGAIKIQPGRDMVTLFSCHPVGTSQQRYLVQCERVKVK
ncbi:MAG: class C sortase [Actinomycetia bacterium]|nr:class C sortase [Actinomycetes bacterium]